MEHQEAKMKKRMFGNMKFIGELYKRTLLKSGVIYGCFSEIIDRKPMKDDYIELLCILLHTVGASIDSKFDSNKLSSIEEKKKMDDIFDKIERLKNR